ncbi:MAG: DUF367 family protein [Candidatus Bathyarchaeia archaeon]
MKRSDESSQVRLFVCHLSQDDPRRCTAVKMRKFRAVIFLGGLSRAPRRAVVLNPAAEGVLHPGERDALEKGGIVAVDCSWNKVEPVFSHRLKGQQRRLPALLAANPVNYGHLGKLSTAEALAGALYVCGFDNQAKRILALFSWGGSFLTLNQDPLAEYSTARSREEIRQIEESFFGKSTPEDAHLA